MAQGAEMTGLLRQTAGSDSAIPAEVRDWEMLYPWTREPFSFQRRPHLESEVSVVGIVGPQVHDEEPVLGFHVRGHQRRREILRRLVVSPALHRTQVARQQIVCVSSEAEQNHHLVGHLNRPGSLRHRPRSISWKETR